MRNVRVVGGRLRQRRGQSILEYLVIVTVVIIAILAIRGTVQNNMNQTYTNAAAQTSTAATELGALLTE